MKKIFLFLFFGFFIFTLSSQGQNKSFLPRLTPAGKGIVNTRVDNISYWKKMVKMGFVVADPYYPVAKAVYTSGIISGKSVRTQDSPDVPVTNQTNTTQSENSIFVSPVNEEILLNSNNSTDWNGSTSTFLYGNDALNSFDAGLTWSGTLEGPGEPNSGDPSTAIDRDNRWFVGYINNNLGQSVAYSTNQGQTWSNVVLGTTPGGYDIMDKNHMWVDNSLSSPYQGYLYSAWTNFVGGSPSVNQIEIVRSNNHGISWTSPLNISSNVAAGSFNHGVNIQTGPDGQVYVVWAIYDSWPSDESALGFAKSIDGGGIFTPATRIINNIKGIRFSSTTKNMRVHSLPSMAVDLSGGINNGNIYVVWTNIGVPGINSGSDLDVYLIRSTDNGTTWSAPIRVNQDPSGMGKQHYFPWITCDPENGNLCVIYYDDRNVLPDQCETWVSFSYDAGNSWEDIKVSDVAFTPSPIAGLASSYFGDYIGITSRNRKVYPIWTDNRNGYAMTYVSPFDLGPAPGQPWVIYDSYSLSSISQKNGQNLDYGDSLYLSLGLQNIGDQQALNTIAYLSSPSPFITLTDSTESYGNFDPGEVKVIQDGYSLKVSDTIPNGLMVRFNVRVISGDTNWCSHFYIQSHAPALKVNSITILDTAGNHNGRLDPGETTNAIFSISNPGDFPSPDVLAVFSTQSDYITINSNNVFLDTLNPGQVKNASFNITVSDEASPGISADLTINVFSGLYHTVKTFHEGIGIIVEDWETNTFTKFPWVGGGNHYWIISGVEPYEGTYCLKSGIIFDQQSSEISLDYVSGIDDSISFYRKVSSEPGYDFLYFYMDGVQQGAWSGEEPWKRVSFFVPAGTHNFRWKYKKDVFLSVGQDCAWLDFIVFPPHPLPAVYAGPSYDTICAGENYVLHGSASDYDSIRWTTYGDGVFSNDTIFDPFYTPGTNDIITGKVRLKLTAYGTYGGNSKSIRLIIGGIPNPVITVDPRDTLCAGQTVLLGVDTTGNSAYSWVPGNYKTPVISVDTSVAGGLGSHLFKVTVTNKYNCSASDSARITFKDCTGIEEKDKDLSCEIYPNPNNGQFIIRIHSKSEETLDIRIINSVSNLVYVDQGITCSRNIEKTCDLRHLASGIYLVVIERETGSLRYKLVIQK